MSHFTSSRRILRRETKVALFTGLLTNLQINKECKMSMKTWIVFLLPRRTERYEHCGITNKGQAVLQCTIHEGQFRFICLHQNENLVAWPRHVFIPYFSNITGYQDISFRQSALREFLVKEEVLTYLLTYSMEQSPS